MRRTICWMVGLILWMSHAASAGLMINELYVNPPGADNGREFFELRDAPGTSLNNHFLLVIEGDGGGAGVIDQVLSLNGFSTGTNGLFVWRDAASGSPAAGTNVNTADFSPDIENGTNTYILVTGFTGTLASDLDTNNDGVLDSTPWASVVDAVAWSDGGAGDLMYSGAFGGPAVDTGVFTPDLAFRDSSSNNWFFTDVLDPGEVFDSTNFADATGSLVDPSTLGFDFQSSSLGNSNPQISAVPEPSSFALSGLGLIGGWMAWRRRKSR